MIHKYRKIKIKGLLSDPLNITRVRQGCLLSMLLYIIAIEVLTNFINTDKMFKVIQKGDHEIKIVNMTKVIETGDHEIKIVNFSDDTTILL